MLSKGGNKHMRTLNNTEWGGGAGSQSAYRKPHSVETAMLRIFNRHFIHNCLSQPRCSNGYRQEFIPCLPCAPLYEGSRA